jgi:hypothetical protein
MGLAAPLARRAAALASLIACACAACVGTTGGQLVTFPAAAAGPADAIAGEPLRFTTDRGWTVVLSTATLHVGALYLDQSMPVSGSQGTNCVLPGTYVGQVTAGLDVNLLSPAPQPFPGQGSGTTEPPALVGQVWLTGGDVDVAATPSPPTTILTIAGTASTGDIVMPFEGKLTIGANRQASGSAAAGADPICRQRIVSPIPTSVVVGSTGGLLLRVDPRLFFVNVDFSQLAKFSDSYGFSDDPTSAGYTQPSLNLYQNLHSAGRLYTFSWTLPP